MNLTALQARCAFRYRDTTNRVVTAAEWTDYLNDAYLDVAASDPQWPFLETRTTGLSIAGGAGTVALPTDAWRVTSVYDETDKWALNPLGGQDYRRWFPDPAGNLGSPEYYRLRGSTLEVYPWPASTTTFAVDVATPPAALAAANDEPIFAEQYHRILVHGALARAYEDDMDEKSAAVNQARFDRMLQQMRYDLLSPRTEGYPVVQDTFF